MFGKPDLQLLVNVAGDAFREEDFYLRQCATRQPHVFGSAYPPGIFRLYNERYYQCLILRRLLHDYLYRVDMEKDLYDLVLYTSPGTPSYNVVGEIKCWRSSGGRSEIPKILSDFAKIVKSGLPGFELIVAGHTVGQAPQDVEFLASELRVSLDAFVEPCSFATRIWPRSESGWSPGEATVHGIYLPPDVSRLFRAIPTSANDKDG